jgi:hypothetical protein
MYVSLKIVKAMPFKSLELRLTVLLFLVSQDRNSFALMQTHCPGMEENGCHRTTVPPSHHRHQQLQFILLNTTISNSHLIWSYCSIISFSSSPSWNYQCKTSLLIPPPQSPSQYLWKYNIFFMRYHYLHHHIYKNIISFLYTTTAITFIKI